MPLFVKIKFLESLLTYALEIEASLLYKSLLEAIFETLSVPVIDLDDRCELDEVHHYIFDFILLTNQHHVDVLGCKCSAKLHQSDQNVK